MKGLAIPTGALQERDGFRRIEPDHHINGEKVRRPSQGVRQPYPPNERRRFLREQTSHSERCFLRLVVKTTPPSCLQQGEQEETELSKAWLYPVNPSLIQPDGAVNQSFMSPAATPVIFGCCGYVWVRVW